MIFLTKEDKEVWEKYTLNMDQLRLNIRQIKKNVNDKNLCQQLPKENKKRNTKKNTFEQFLKLLNKRRIDPGGIIDLHGFNLKEAKVRLKKYLFQAFSDNKRNILIITGKGLNKSGLLKKEVPIWLDDSEIKNFVISYKVAPQSFGGEGALIIRLKNKQKVSM